MSLKTNHDQLLTEVLAEASPADYRAALLTETLRRARRRRQFRLTRQVVGVLAVLSLFVVLVGPQFSRRPVSAPPQVRLPSPPSYKLVRTQSLPAAAMVSTRALATPAAGWSVAPVTEVTTTTGGFRPLNDDQLLALLAGKPAVLIRTSPHTEELVFANPADQKLLMKN